MPETKVDVVTGANVSLFSQGETVKRSTVAALYLTLPVSVPV